MKSLFGIAVLSILAIASTSSTLEAGLPDLKFWFEASPLNSSSSVIEQGKDGEDTTLGCDNSGGDVTCSWQVTMVMDNTTAGAGTEVGAIAADFVGDTNRHSASYLNPGNYPLNDDAFTSFPGVADIAEYKRIWVPVVDNGNGPEFVDIPEGTYSVLQFTLDTSVLGTDLSLDPISIANNSLLTTIVNEPPNNPPGDAIVQFGDATPYNGSDIGGIAADVIKFQLVPEPTTCLLLLLSTGCAVIRRRR